MPFAKFKSGRNNLKLFKSAKRYLQEKFEDWGIDSRHFNDPEKGPALLEGMANHINNLSAQLEQQESLLQEQKRKTQRAIKELQSVQNSYFNLFDLTPIGFFNLSQRGDILGTNEKACELLGRTKEELIGKPLSMFVHPGTLPAYYDTMRSPQHSSQQHAEKNTKTNTTCEVQLIKKRGGVLDVHMEITCKSTQRGKIQELMVWVNNVSEQKEYERALIGEMDRIQITLNSIGDAVITTDAAGIIDYMNPVAESLTGWKMEQAIGNRLQTVFNVIDERSKKTILNPVAKCLRENRPITLGKDCVLVGKGNKKYAIQNSMAPLRNRHNEVLGVVLVFSNITEARNMAQQIEHQATHDALTGLVNRREFEKRLSNALRSAKDSKAQHCLCYLDLDQFKIVNDTAGHMAGDELLRKLTIVLSSKIRARDTLARHGGDEFGLLLDNCPLDQAYKIANSLVAAVRNFQFQWQGRNYNIGVSIGLVPICPEARNTGELMSQADVACYTAKDLGRNRVHVYEQNDGRKLTNHHSDLLRVAGLTDALKEDRFRLYCQEIMPLNEDDNVPHYEILLRSVDKNGKIELPKAFVPAAERYGMMSQIDRWVIENAFQRYMRLFGPDDEATIAINLSGNSIADPSLMAFVHTALYESGIPPKRVCFEITETAAISNLEQARLFVIDLKALGCKFALDDFGSGLSSFTYLKNLPVDYLKIDGSFVRDMTNDSVSQAMVAAINEVGHIMGIKTIAECAENEKIVAQLTKLGVDYAQGFAVGNPMPMDLSASKRRHDLSLHA